MTNRLYHLILCLGLCLSCSTIHAQDTYRVLFIGNSYTAFNNLPQLVDDMAHSVGDTLVHDRNTPGGFRLIDHAVNAITQNKIMAGNWDYVVMQGQSQEPIIQSGVFQSGANQLHTLIKQYNPCAVPMSYMTWGRKNGDANNCGSFPLMCTYELMDSTLRERYLKMTNILNGEVSPVSAVWRYLRVNHPNIELYSADGSHPSASGSYAAACCFYAAIFKKDPSQISFDFTLDANTAASIRSAAKVMVFDQLAIWDFKKPPRAEFKISMDWDPLTIGIGAKNPDGLVMDYHWDLGDGNTDSIQSFLHQYANNGTYTIQLSTTTCDINGVHTATADTTFQLCAHTPTVFDESSWTCLVDDTLWTQQYDSYQWYLGCQPIPGEVAPFLANPLQYTTPTNSWISVLATRDGCSEISRGYSAVAPWTGYTFELLGDSCTNDTLVFVLRHQNDPLSGDEVIQWYQNGNLLSFNGDSLLITEVGTYEGRVVNPLANCPLDTTYSPVVKLNCGLVGFESPDDQLAFWHIFPNPASSHLRLEFENRISSDQVQIVDAHGQLIMEKNVTSDTSLDVSFLPKGLYLIRLKSKPQTALKFIKQ
ncbi:MAG: T9SS type A sorting domain-containing protein [Bacteroidota bacterium]